MGLIMGRITVVIKEAGKVAGSATCETNRYGNLYHMNGSFPGKKMQKTPLSHSWFDQEFPKNLGLFLFLHSQGNSFVGNSRKRETA
jgi:hypothetical protein